MRDRVWLDVQTGDTFLPRVRIVQIIVKRTGDDIVLRQDWLEEGGGDVWPNRQRITVDAANIWRVAPTALRLDEVQQWGEPPPPPEPEKKSRIKLGDEVSDMVAQGIVQAALLYYDTTADELKRVTEHRYTARRYVAMLVMFEMTDLTPHQITAQFGYRSPMPLVCARDHLTWYVRDPSRRASSHVRPQTVRELGKVADKLFKPERYRSSRTWPGSYTPVL